MRECITAGAKAFGWDKARKEVADQPAGSSIRRGVGMACGLWAAGGGAPPSTIILKLFSDGSVSLNMGASDLGTGTKTVMAMVVSEELGIKPGTVQIEHADTGTTQFATPSGGSKTIPTESPAVRAAAIHVKQQLLALAAEDLKTDASSLSLKADAVISRTDSKQIKIVDISGLKRRGLIVGVGYRGHNHDLDAVKAALRTRAGYIGLLGSRRKKALLARALEQDGFSKADIARVIIPVGLDIGSRTPEEIAVSIMAQIIERRSDHGTSRRGHSACSRFVQEDGAVETASPS